MVYPVCLALLDKLYDSFIIIIVIKACALGLCTLLAPILAQRDDCCPDAIATGVDDALMRIYRPQYIPRGCKLWHPPPTHTVHA